VKYPLPVNLTPLSTLLDVRNAFNEPVFQKFLSVSDVNIPVFPITLPDN